MYPLKKMSILKKTVFERKEWIYEIAFISLKVYEFVKANGFIMLFPNK